MNTPYQSLRGNTGTQQNHCHRILSCFSVGVAFAFGLVWLGRENVGLGRTASLSADEGPAAPPYLAGWSRERWTFCNAVAEPCPMEELDIPQHGCASSNNNRNLLLTAAGLTSPSVRKAFHDILERASASSDFQHVPASKRVVLVLDAAEDAYESGAQLTSSYEYCEMRKAELSSLGASVVTCVIVDPSAREHLLKRGPVEGGASNGFLEAMRRIDDDFIFQEMNRAVAIFVECGSPLILAKSFRRKLALTEPAAPGITLKDIIRSRMSDAAGAFAYVGVSSGASLASEVLVELGASEVESLGGDNSGLGLVPNCSFYPHATVQNKQMLHNLAKVYQTGLMAVPDCQPIVDTGFNNGYLSHVCP